MDLVLTMPSSHSGLVVSPRRWHFISQTPFNGMEKDPSEDLVYCVLWERMSFNCSKSRVDFSLSVLHSSFTWHTTQLIHVGG